MPSTSDTPNTSMVGSYFTLKILENHADKIIELSHKGFEYEFSKPVTMDHIDDMISEVSFQDNTAAFKVLLSLKHMVILIYPPGSGKTTMALLLQSFLSSTAVWSEKMTTFFDNCEYARSSKSDFDKFKNSGNVAYINFEDIQGTNRVEFEESLIMIMLEHFEKYCSKEISQQEYARLTKSPGSVYSSLGRFATRLRDKTKITYLLLDSCDTVYNLIAQIGPEAVAVCKSFTKFLKCAVPIGDTGVMLICFGVSPYFAYEFSGKASIHSIDRKTNELGRYFSYSIETIDKVIEAWKLPTSSGECLKIAKFKYDNQEFINPAICVSFLRSLYLKKDFFQVDLVPRSLCLSSIFTLEDRDLLLDILYGPCEKEFSMGVSIMDLITRGWNRKLFYPLFIYGGFLSCTQLNDQKYELSIANETSRCVLEKSLDNIYSAVYKRGFKDCTEIYEMVLANKWREFCDVVSDMLSSMSTNTFYKEKDYNNFLFGLLCPAKLRGFSVQEKVTIRNNIALAGIFPDLTVSNVAAVWELKVIKATNLREKLKRDLTLYDRYNASDISDSHKKTVLNEISTKLLDAKTQIIQYASSLATAERCNVLKCFIGIFYLNHIVLFVSEYKFINRDEPINEELLEWTPHCSQNIM